MRAWCLVLAFAAAGCAPADPARALLEDYRDRVARVLERPAAGALVPSLEPWPRARLRTLEVEPQRTNLVRFLRLHDCGLGALVGERSSPLGRVMPPSQRLAYEHRFLRVADRCLGELAADPEADEDREALAEIVAGKRARLDAVVWNATLGSEALASVFTLDVDALAPERVAGSGSEVTGAVRELVRRAPRIGDPTLEPERWEAPWQVLSGSAFGGRARRSIALLALALEEVAGHLEAREAERPVCPQGIPTDRARILQNVFTRYYAGAVQPYLAAVDAELRPWFAALAALRAAQGADAPAGFDAATAPIVDPAVPGGEWSRLVAARDRHTQAWQDLLGRCDLAPSRP